MESVHIATIRTIRFPGLRLIKWNFFMILNNPPLSFVFLFCTVLSFSVVKVIIFSCRLQEWMDERLTWKPEEFNLTEIVVEAKRLWVPEFAVING